jgi:hypothetical protein
VDDNCHRPGGDQHGEHVLEIPVTVPQQLLLLAHRPKLASLVMCPLVTLGDLLPKIVERGL